MPTLPPLPLPSLSCQVSFLLSSPSYPQSRQHVFIIACAAVPFVLISVLSALPAGVGGHRVYSSGRHIETAAPCVRGSRQTDSSVKSNTLMLFRACQSTAGVASVIPGRHMHARLSIHARMHACTQAQKQACTSVCTHPLSMKGTATLLPFAGCSQRHFEGI